MKVEIMIEELKKLIEYIENLLDESSELKHNIEIKRALLRDVMNFPDYMETELSTIESILEDIITEYNTNLIEAPKPKERKQLYSYLYDVDTRKAEEHGFQDIEENWAKGLGIPERFWNKCVAMLEYDSRIKKVYSDDTEEFENSKFYKLCLDPGNIEHRDIWSSVNESDVIFINEYCKIYELH